MSTALQPTDRKGRVKGDVASGGHSVGFRWLTFLVSMVKQYDPGNQVEVGEGAGPISSGAVHLGVR